MKEFYDLFDKIYNHHGAGGLLHIVLDDQNVEDSHLKFCRNCVKENNEIRYVGMEGVYYKCLDILYSLSEDERYNLIISAWNR